MEPTFIHLHCHSEYSLVDGMLRIDNVVKHCRKLEMPAVAITDMNNVFALVKFYRAALAAGIKPIIGVDIVLRDEKHVSRVVLLVQNQQGYTHITELLTKAYLQGQRPDGMPEVQWSWLQACAGGLIVLSGGRHGDVGQALVHGDHERAERLLQRWQRHFPECYYLELVRTGREHERQYLHEVIKLAQQYHVPVVATNDVCFLQADDFTAHEARVCIHSGYRLDDTKRPREYSAKQYLKSPKEMQTLFADIPEALANSVEIAKRCNVILSLGTAYLPDFPTPKGVGLADYLRQQTEQGLQAYWQKIKSNAMYSYQDYQARLDIELDVIISMGFPGYFLIVADFIQWAKDNDIPVGPGRGSGAGSLVAFCLKITALDPLEHQLLFERFLNPERVSMPDFDIDFCMERRDEVIDYVAGRYGHDSVSQIITYGTMAAKAVVRDVGRVLGYPYGLVDKIAKLIPFEIGITLDKALASEEELRERYETEEEITILLDLAKKLEGVCRNAGKHAGGVVIAPSKLTDFTPLYCEPSGEHPVTQLDKDDVEAVGLVKFDFLGLRTLTIIHWALTAINRRLKREGLSLVDIDAIPLDDVKSFDLLKSCATTAVFQLESRGMKDLIRRVQPDSFDEITALVALFRPGPLQSGMVDDFIDRKHGRAVVQYPHPDLEEILASTYGVILYQEQVMKIAQVLANYSLGGADLLRRAMGKKKPEEMAKQREIFRQGALDRGVEEKVAQHIFDLMEKFAGYGFNKSHSAAYALIAYQTAYLKAHFPAEFMAAVLSSDMDNTNKVVGFLRECKRMGLVVINPNINRCHYHFTVNAVGEILYGLGAVKGVGQAACENIVAAREADGQYLSLFDVCQRVDMSKLSRRGLEPLIRAGALDELHSSRACLMATIDKAVQAAEQHRRNIEGGQVDLFAELGSDESNGANGHSVLEYVSALPWSVIVRLQAEKDTLGCYLSGHPFEVYYRETQHFTVAKLDELPRYLGKSTTMAGIITQQRPIVTKAGKRMLILTLEDQSTTAEVTVFSRLLTEVQEELQTDAVVIVKAKIEQDKFSGGVRCVAEKITSLLAMRTSRAKRLLLTLGNKAQVDELLAQLPLVMQPYCGGGCDVVISYQVQSTKAEIQLGKKWRVRPEDALIEQLGQCCGQEAVLLEY